MGSIRTRLLAVLTLSVFVAAAQVSAQKAGQSSKISTGIVQSVQQVKLDSEAGKGALIGGGLGLLSAGGKSTSKKARNSIIGATAGGALANASQGNRNGMAYTVRTGDGSSIRVVTDQTEIRVGDCVAVEENGSTANVRRLSPTACDSASAKARQELQVSFQQEATECHNAKQQLIEAKTADAVDLAQRKMEILCSN
jgi:outer membrane lipoprotein SlyB